MRLKNIKFNLRFQILMLIKDLFLTIPFLVQKMTLEFHLNSLYYQNKLMNYSFKVYQAGRKILI
jgi:hypothetical protein